nr:hypothetical protein [Tanacetum cinerariifolium]
MRVIVDHFYHVLILIYSLSLSYFISSTVCHHWESSPETRLLSETATTISTVMANVFKGKRVKHVPQLFNAKRVKAQNVKEM